MRFHTENTEVRKKDTRNLHGGTGSTGNEILLSETPCPRVPPGDFLLFSDSVFSVLCVKSRLRAQLATLLRMNRTTIAKSAATAVLALIIGSASAQQAGLQSYDVELVIFRNLSSNASSEDWSRELGATSQSSALGDEEESSGAAIVSAPVATATETFPDLPTGRMELGAIADQLKRSRGYQRLAHFGWTQPGFPRTEAHYMSIDSKAEAGTGLTGRVALSRGRYLHLTLDLVLEPEGSGERYVLRQTRRMRSNERHYIDHPKFGVIALIRQSQ